MGATQRGIAAQSAQRHWPSEMLVTVMKASEGPMSSIQIMCQIPSDDASVPQMLLLDLSDNGGFFKPAEAQVTSKCCSPIDNGNIIFLEL